MKKKLLIFSAMVVGATSFAQNIPSGSFDGTVVSVTTGPSNGTITTTVPSGWTNHWDYNVDATAASFGYINSTNNTTNSSTSKKIGTKSIIVHSTVVSTTPSTVYAPGISVSSPSTATAVTTLSIVVDGSFAVTSSKSAITGGNFLISDAPKALEGWVKYKSTANHGGIGVEILSQTTPLTGTVTPIGGYLRPDGNTTTLNGIKTVSATTTSSVSIAGSGAEWVYFIMPINMIPGTTAGSARITLLSALPTETLSLVGDTLMVDGLRFLSCLPDAAVSAVGITTPTISPALSYTIANADSRAFDKTFTFAVPVTGVVPPGQAVPAGTAINFDSVSFDGMSNQAAAGLTYTPGHSSGITYAGTTSCFTVKGTLPAAENVQYDMVISGTGYGTSAGFQISVLGSQPTATLSITVGDPLGIETLDASTFAVAQNSPNPFDGATSISFNTVNAGAVTFTVVDMLGRVVNTQTIKANTGVNTVNYTAVDAGTYFYTLSDGVNKVTKKMVVSK